LTTGLIGAGTIALWFLIIGAVMLFVAFEAFFMGLLALSAEFLLSTLAWWSIMGGNMFATMSMGFYLWVKHPKLRQAHWRPTRWIRPPEGGIRNALPGAGPSTC